MKNLIPAALCQYSLAAVTVIAGGLLLVRSATGQGGAPAVAPPAKPPTPPPVVEPLHDAVGPAATAVPPPPPAATNVPAAGRAAESRPPMGPPPTVPSTEGLPPPVWLPFKPRKPSATPPGVRRIAPRAPAQPGASAGTISISSEGAQEPGVSPRVETVTPRARPVVKGVLPSYGIERLGPSKDFPTATIAPRGGAGRSVAGGIPTRTLTPPGPGAPPHVTLPDADEPAPATPTETAPSRSIERPKHLPTKRDFERALPGRYQITESEVNLVDGPHGARGSFSLSGDLTPRSAREAGLVARGPRAVAEAFIAAEADVLGLGRVDDLREVRSQVKEPSGSTVVIYRRYVGDLELDGASLVAAVDSSGHLFLVSGNVVPLPPELFDAAGRSTLTEADARAIAVGEQVKGGDDPNAEMALSKFAVPEAPYVVWRVRTEPWIYRLDAFTGAVVSKEWGIRYLK